MTTASPLSSLDRTLSALAEPNRRRILEVLAQRRQSVEALATSLEASTWNTLKHIRVLEEAGLVRSQKVGRQRFCQLQLEGLTLVSNWTSDLRQFWTSNLSRLEERLANSD